MSCQNSCTSCQPGTDSQNAVCLISPYDLGRQPFALAEAAALLEQAGFTVSCIDLSQQRLTGGLAADTRVVFIHLGMHTATRIAVEALPRIRELAPGARIAVFGWYAPVNEKYLRRLGVDAVFGGESDQDMVAYADSVRQDTDHPARHQALVNLGRIEFRLPQRDGLPPLDRYAHLQLPDGSTRVMGFTETTRGCKHLCRHCPVVPVYGGRFRAVPADIVLDDIRQQVARGAQHISFGDPDFLNGPNHALRIVREMHAEFPDLTWDAVIKIEHLLKHQALLPELRDTGCRLVTTAAESVDDLTLQHLDKGHRAADLDRVVRHMRELPIALAPTFVPFTPWTTLDNYCQLLDKLVELELIASINPVQLTLRLLIPEGSRLLELPLSETHISDHREESLGYAWRHPDPRVDELQRAVAQWVERADAQGLERLDIFNGVRDIAFRASGRTAGPIPAGKLGSGVPTHSESWYCCAEPTGQQLAGF